MDGRFRGDRPPAELLQRRGLLLVLSDFYDDEAATQRELRHIVQRGHDAAMLQVVAREERTLTFKEQLELRDLESGETRVIDPISAGAAYRENVSQFLERWRSFAQHDGIDYALLDTGDAPERALRDYLVRRAARQASPGEPVAQHAATR